MGVRYRTLAIPLPSRWSGRCRAARPPRRRPRRAPRVPTARPRRAGPPRRGAVRRRAAAPPRRPWRPGHHWRSPSPGPGALQAAPHQRLVRSRSMGSTAPAVVGERAHRRPVTTVTDDALARGISSSWGTNRCTSTPAGTRASRTESTCGPVVTTTRAASPEHPSTTRRRRSRHAREPEGAQADQHAGSASTRGPQVTSGPDLAESSRRRHRVELRQGGHHPNPRVPPANGPGAGRAA